MHEICHFMFFMKCNKLFTREKIETDNNSLFWYMSEIVIDPILNNNCFRKIFRHKFRSYDSFYKVRIGNELMMDKIHLIFSTNRILSFFSEYIHSNNSVVGELLSDKLVTNSLILIPILLIIFSIILLANTRPSSF